MMSTLHPRFQLVQKKQLIGIRRKMSFTKMDPSSIWETFMPRKKEIPFIKNNFLFSVEVYDSESYFAHFDPTAEFEKWAAVEVDSIAEPPEKMELLIIPEGEYAVFTYKGRAQDAFTFYQAIYSEWLPTSSHKLASRPHFARMGDLYKKDDRESEEEIYIPIKLGI